MVRKTGNEQLIKKRQNVRQTERQIEEPRETKVGNEADKQINKAREQRTESEIQ